MTTPITNNPLLAKIKMPGRVFQLPSRGLLYSENELANTISDAELHVKPMSALDEIILKNPDMLFSGKALDQVFGTCVEGINKPVQLLGKDVDALMLFLRLVTYGPEYDIVVNHQCKDSKSHPYTVDLESIFQNMKYIDPTTISEIYTINLDNGQIVIVQPARYAHIIEILQNNQGKKTLNVEDMQLNLISGILNIIKSVDGITDKDMLKEWISAAPAPYINKIADSIEKTNDWGLNLTTDLKCKDCGEIFKVDVPINPISFFS